MERSRCPTGTIGRFGPVDHGVQTAGRVVIDAVSGRFRRVATRAEELGAVAAIRPPYPRLARVNAARTASVKPGAHGPADVATYGLASMAT